MDNEAWNKFIKFAWKFGIENLVATCTLDLRQNLEYFMKSILGILYIVSKLKKLEVQHFKQCANWSWNEEVMIIWKQVCRVERAFQNGFEIQLMNSKSNLKWRQFQIHRPPLWYSPPPPQELHLGHSIHLKWAPHNYILLLFSHF